LLSAYSRDTKKITRNIALSAIKEIFGKVNLKSGFFVLEIKPILLLISLGIVFGTLFIYPPVYLKEIKASPGSVAVIHKITTQQKEKERRDPQKLSTLNTTGSHKNKFQTDMNPIPDSLDNEKPIVVYQREQLESFLQELNSKNSRNIAMKCILDLWHTEVGIKDFLQTVEDHQEYFVLATKQNHLNIKRLEGDLEFVKNLNHASILELHTTDDPSPKYLALIEGANENLIFGFERKRIQIHAKDLSVFWKNGFDVI